MGVSYNRNVGLALDADLTLLCRHDVYSLLIAALKPKREAHKHALKLRCRVVETRV